MWQLEDSGKEFTSLKKGKRRSFRGMLQDSGTYVFFAELVKEISAKTWGPSSLSRFVQLHLCISPMNNVHDPQQYSEKGKYYIYNGFPKMDGD